jgi:magnesium-transporting ATPase (P-type)
VLRTGFTTTKGELVRSILYPKPVDFQLNKDTYKFIGGLAIVALCGMIFSIAFKVVKKNPAADILKRSLDIITIAIPPVLPGALTASIIYAQDRLKNKKIFCISPRTINVCGTLNLFVFDKTGTLTENGLDLKYVLPVKQNARVEFGKQRTNAIRLVKNKRILEAMASCHSITHINGDIAGDPLDLKMFEFTKWSLSEPQDQGDDVVYEPPKVVPPIALFEQQKSLIKHDLNTIEIVKQFPFSSGLQRMSVITKEVNENNYSLYCKGSPEKIAELSNQDSLPHNFLDVLSSFTKQGFRVIAIAYKTLKLNKEEIKNVDRDELEHDLAFLGLILYLLS